jgi:two-component system sensor histidine kinase/response regulator
MVQERGKRRPGPSWRTLAGTAGVAVVAAAAVQVLIHEFFMSAGMLSRHVVSAGLQAVVILIPAVMYLNWRSAAQREAETLRRLRRSETLREDMTGMLVHDLKTPTLTAGIALNSLAGSKQALSGLGEENVELLRMARDSVTRSERMIGDILDVSVAESGALRLDITEVDLPDLAESVAQEARLTAMQKEVEVRTDPPPSAVRLPVDEERTRRVIENLVANAVKSSPRGGVVRIAVRGYHDGARITVEDSGPGVPPEDRKRVFEKYTSAQGAGRMSAGLGLAFCRLIVEAHGGHIWVEDSPEGGARFSLTLPGSTGGDNHEED